MDLTAWDALMQPGRADDFFADCPRVAFDPTRGDRLIDAWWCAELSRLAYCPRERERYLRATPLREVAAFDSRGSHALVVGPRDASALPFAIVAFRGTDELRDWIANVRALPVRWAPGGSVHRGFRRALAKLWRPLRRALRDLEGPWFCAGHSLGGAMALLAGSALRVPTVHTFGAPCTGDAEFARSLAEISVRRFVNGRDLVPRVRIPGFVHVGECVHLGKERDETEVSPPTADDRRWFDPTPQLADHAPLAYVRALRRALGEAGTEVRS